MSCNVVQASKRNHWLAFLVAVLWTLIFAAPIWAQVDKVSVPLTDPTRPVRLKASLLNGGITVTANDGKDVLVEARVRDGDKAAREGSMKRIPMIATGLSVEEENNEVDIGANHRVIDLTIQVPRHTSLHLSTVNEGDISVTGVDGDIDVNDVNGDVTLKNVSGNAVAHALNGKVLVNFERVNPQKPMAFSSMNGDIDVTFPADLKANVSMSNDRGDVFSDFDIALENRPPVQTPTQGTREGGKYRVQIDKLVRGKINGGGQEIQFKNFNGSIYIRRAGTKAQ